MRKTNRLTQALLLAGTAASLSGCIAAAAIPIVAGAGGMVRSGIEADKADDETVADGRVELRPAATPTPAPAPVTATAPAPTPAPTPVVVASPEPAPALAAVTQPEPEPIPAPMPEPEPEPEPAPTALATRPRSEPVIVMTLADVQARPTPAPAPTPDPLPEPEPAALAAAEPAVELPAPAPEPDPMPEPVELAAAELPAVPPSDPAPEPAPAPVPAATPAAETLETAFADLAAPEPMPAPAPAPEPEPVELAAAVEPEPAPATMPDPTPDPTPDPMPEPVELAAAELPAVPPSEPPAPAPTPAPAPAPAPAPQQAQLAPVDPPVAPSEMAPAVEPGQSLVGYAALRSYALRTLGGGLPLPSAVLADPTSLQPVRRECMGNSPTIVIDLDPAGGLVPLSGPLGLNNTLARVLQELRARDVNVAWITDRTPLDARAVRDRLVASGLDPDSQDSIYVERYPGESKQARRESIGQTSCIIAVAGDERADFDDLYNYLIDYTDARALEPMLGTGWFLIDNPVGE